MSAADPQTTNCGFADVFDDIETDAWESSSTPVASKPGRKEVESIAQLNGFTSREPKVEVKAERLAKESEGQINIRAKQSVLDRFRDFGRQQEPRWPSGYVLERALEALEREMKK
ncbi:MAG: hypothetical protein AB8B81_22760 [Halioglobus sp.]